MITCGLRTLPARGVQGITELTQKAYYDQRKSKIFAKFLSRSTRANFYVPGSPKHTYIKSIRKTMQMHTKRDTMQMHTIRKTINLALLVVATHVQ